MQTSESHVSRLSIIVPAYNEEENIERVVRSLLDLREHICNVGHLSDVEIIVVNDGSKDRTAGILQGLLNTFERGLRVVTHELNSGYGAALKTGFRAATGTHLSFMDADGTISPEFFGSMYKALKEQEADMVVGTRFGSDHNSEMPFVRRLGNHFFAMLLSFLSGTKIKDSASGMRLFRKEILPQIYPLPDGLHFTPAMSTKVIHEGLKTIEIPIPYSVRGGESKLRVISDGLKFLKIIIGTVLLYNPFKVFLLGGLLFEAVAAALISAPVYTFVMREQVSFSDYIYRSIAAMYFFTAGIQVILFGILARFIVSTFFRSYESGRFIHRLNAHLRVYEWMSWYGLIVCGFGAAINALYITTYWLEGGLSLHWAWLLLGAGFIIVGIQMVITGIVMRILKDIKIAVSVAE